MRIGIIDLGTNSVRFDVHSVDRNGKSRLLHREKLMIRLGQGVFLDGKLDLHAIHRTIQAFNSFHRTATLLQAEKVVASGTSALREAIDADNLISMIRRKTGIDIRVISGQEEAQLIALGILANESTPKGRFGLIDIGGGSTEISICEGKKILHSVSFSLGAARLQQIFLKSSPPKIIKDSHLDPILNLRKYIKSILLPKIVLDQWPHVSTLIGSSGTIRALQKIIKKTALSDTANNSIDRKAISKLIKFMSPLSKPQLLGIPGMETKRADIILSGALLLDECMDALGANQFITTTYSLRDGILDREIRQISHRRGPEIQFKMSDLYSKAKRLGADESHLKQVVTLAETLFDGTQRIHKLSSEWKRYLTAATILHDTGEAVSSTHHEIHSYYIVRNADFLAMEKWESEFIAQLCLNHNAGELSKKDIEFLTEKSKKNAFHFLLGLLRVADALDRGHKSTIKIKKVKLERTQVTIFIQGENTADLEILRVEQKKKLFEKTFKRHLIVQITK